MRQLTNTLDDDYTAV